MSGVTEPELTHAGLNLADEPIGDRVQINSDVFGFWVFLMSDAVLFALLFAIYGTMEGKTAGGPNPTHDFKFHSAIWETAALLTSSFAYGMVSICLKHHARPRWVMLGLGVTFCLGAYFLGMEIHDFMDMFGHGSTPEADGWISSFFVLVGMHGFHVSCGLIWILTMAAQIAIFGLDQRVKINLIRLGLFWHFLDVVWVVIFSVVYLQGLLR
ncbi:MAG TPA: cytochrome c oxidase subunit 3 [Acidisoma sp.]|jgi:cytochrome o ubiquinol oxidase subunit 3|nr:cytochrome c oxidase subunit 3 [Acidisoma sp.]